MMRWRRVATLGIGLAGIVACSRAPRTGPAEPVHTFGRADAPIASSGVAADEGGWRIRRADSGTVPLFEVTPPGGLEQVVLTYRAPMKAENLAGKAYLEMWVRVSVRRELLSLGLAHPRYRSPC